MKAIENDFSDLLWGTGTRVETEDLGVDRESRRPESQPAGRPNRKIKHQAEDKKKKKKKK